MEDQIAERKTNGEACGLCGQGDLNLQVQELSCSGKACTSAHVPSDDIFYASPVDDNCWCSVSIRLMQIRLS